MRKKNPILDGKEVADAASLYCSKKPSILAALAKMMIVQNIDGCEPAVACSTGKSLILAPRHRQYRQKAVPLPGPATRTL